MYGSLVRRARQARNLTQKELADIAGVEQPNISAIEAERRVPNAATLHRLLHACGFQLTASAGDFVIACPPPDDEDVEDGQSRPLPEEIPIETRVKMLVGALDVAEATIRAR